MPTAARILSFISRSRPSSLHQTPTNMLFGIHGGPAVTSVSDNPGNGLVSVTQPWNLSNIQAGHGFPVSQTAYEPTNFEDQYQGLIDPKMVGDISEAQQVSDTADTVNNMNNDCSAAGFV
ncbi:uncharacterized protein MAM_01532 [Metarhizium album ARSEF 1941]|uniref:Uncharacterized protein n=1 Tax=Metarhizium album (strain ARSEF 1941) TaxID=1081103 RepID=A0A0B2X367_METAS|nr:uncharacterized protein MAM_01532 [Metarhizium album ARSEF 1941]KHO00754.1 hypothetical protein MAM_01532 [Metarhizium album ARSEF 1941]